MLNTVSITDLKQNTAKIVEQVNSSGKSIIVMQRSKPAAVIVDPQEYEALISHLEDLEDLKTIEERKGEVSIPWEDVKKEFGF